MTPLTFSGWVFLAFTLTLTFWFFVDLAVAAGLDGSPRSWPSKVTRSRTAMQVNSIALALAWVYQLWLLAP